MKKESFADQQPLERAKENQTVRSATVISRGPIIWRFTATARRFCQTLSNLGQTWHHNCHQPFHLIIIDMIIVTVFIITSPLYLLWVARFETKLILIRVVCVSYGQL